MIRGLSARRGRPRRAGHRRGHLGPGRAGRRGASPRPARASSPASTAPSIENIVEARGVPQVAEFLRGIDDPGQIADTSGYSPDLSFERKVEVLETVDVEARLELVLALGEGHAGRDRAEGQDPHRRQRGHGEAPARVPAARADERDPQGARRGRRGGRRRGVPHEDRRGRHARRRPRRRPSASSGGWSGPASSRPSTAGSAPTSTG